MDNADHVINTICSETGKDVAVGDIAKSAGVAHGLLFHYFGTKRGIYLAALRRAALDLDASCDVSADLPAGRQVR
jgi:AcrR family transcriptional regulator